MHYPYLAPAF
jgi:pimeloyl-ACP methyl ester carboxylesterase